MSKKQLVPLNIPGFATAPTAQYVGDAYVNTGDSTLYFWTGSSWISSSTGASGDGASIASYANFDGGGIYDGAISDAEISQVLTDTFDLGTVL